MLIECPSRWYLGVVVRRTQMTVRLSPAICGHTLGDLGLFLAGDVSSGEYKAELTPLPRAIEINLVTADSVQPYPRTYFARLNKRTHKPTK